MSHDLSPVTLPPFRDHQALMIPALAPWQAVDSTSWMMTSQARCTFSTQIDSCSISLSGQLGLL